MPFSGPIIWSETRQELCESLPYYRAYQTGSYVSSFSSLSRPPSSSLLKSQRRFATLKDSIPYGYLLAGWPSRRDAFAHNGRVIISHGGGKSKVISPSIPTAGPSEPKKASLKQDQSSSDSTIRALLHSARHKLPIVLIAAENYALLPWKLNCGYAVLGWYVITDSWAEWEAGGGEGDGEEGKGFVRCKFRFEWIEAQGEPWWELYNKNGEEGWDPRSRVEMFAKAQRRLVKAMKGEQKLPSTSPASSRSSSATSSRSSSAIASGTFTPKPMTEEERNQLLFGPISSTTIPSLISTTTTTIDAEPPCTLTNAATCLVCWHTSPLVFSPGWMCLEPSCPRFFLSPSGQPFLESSLEFDSSFLHPLGSALNTSFPSSQPPFSLIPARPSSKSMDQARGLWCKHCGRLSCREIIFQPRCAHCDSPVGKWKPLPTMKPPKLSRGPFDFGTKAEKTFDPVISPSSSIKMEMRKVEEAGLVVYSFRFPAMFGDCAVHLVQTDTDLGGKEEEADEIFRGFQKHAWPIDCKVKKVNKREGKRRRVERSTLFEETTSKEEQDTESQPSSLSPSNSSLTPSNSTTPSTTPDADLSEPKEALIPFRRHPLKSHAGGSGRMLTQQFTCNYGVPYKHIVAMGTCPLSASTSPPPILSTLSLLHQRTSVSLSLSSASSASCSSLPTRTFGGFNELYPVLYLTHQKMSYHDDGEPGLGPIVSSLSLGSVCRMKFRLKAKHCPHFPELKSRDRVVLDLPLRHGSILIQEGEDLQMFFEHCINPDGFRIAITGRWIDQRLNDKTPSRGKKRKNHDKPAGTTKKDTPHKTKPQTAEASISTI